MNLNNDKIRERLTDKHNSRHVCTNFRSEFVMRLFNFENDQFSEDYVNLHTTFKDAVAGLIIEKYNQLLAKHKILKKVGIYLLYKNKTIDPDKLLEIKKANYHILRNYYNTKIMPILQKLNDDPSKMYNVIPIVGYKFKPLKDRSHLII